MRSSHVSILELFSDKSVSGALGVLIAITLTATTVLIPGCSSKSPTDPGDTPRPALTASPTSAPPAALIELTGIQIQQNALDSHYVLIGGEFAPLFVDSAGNVFATVPGFIDTIALWPAPPAGPVGVAIMHKRDTIAYGASILTVTPLLEAPGTLVQYVDDMRAVSSSLLAITESLFADSTEASMLLFGYTKALDTFLVADEASLLQTTLAEVQADATALKIVDALIAASGMAASMRSLAEGLDGVAASLVRAKSLAGPAQSTSFNPTDISLAAAMQASVLLHQAGGFIGSSQTGVGSTAFGGLSLFSSFTGLLRFNPVIGLAVSAVALGTALQGLMIQKFIVGAMPSKIKELKLEFAKDTIRTGENTDATFHIVATNKPDPLTVNDLVGVIMSALGTWASTVSTYTNLSDGLKQFLRTNLDDVQRALDDAVLWILNNTRTQLDQYLGSNPNVVYDPGILDLGNPVPLYTWEADIETPFLLELRTLHQNKIVPITDELNWEALYDEFGDATVYAVPSREPEALAFTDPRLANFFGEFGAGAFGKDQTGTGNVRVVIQPELDVQVNMASTIDSVSFEPVTITAGYVNATGQAVPTRDITLTLSSGGGPVSATNGTTDSLGKFVTQVQLSTGSSQVTVKVIALGQVGTIDSAQGTSSRAGDPVPIIANSQAELNAYAGVTHASTVWMGRNTSTSNDIASLTVLAVLQKLSEGGDFVCTGTVLPNFSSLPAGVTVTGGGQLERVAITNNGSLSTLTGLNWITRTSDLTISDNGSLTLFTGLSGLKYVGDFHLRDLPALDKFAGMPLLDSIRNFRISGNVGIRDFEGFPSVSYLGGVTVTGANEMFDFVGFPATVATTGNLDIRNLAKVNSLAGLQVLRDVTGSVYISNIENLTSLEGLGGLQTCGSLSISSCNKLASVSGLSSLSAINGALIVTSCDALDSTEVANWANGIAISGSVIINP